MAQHRRRKIVDDLDVGHETRARVEPFEEIVREQRILRHTAIEGRLERIDVVEALAGEDPLVEQVLIGIGHGGRVGVDARMSGVDTREDRARRARHRDTDARLQDAVALGDAPQRRIDLRLIQRVKNDADQGLRGIARQVGIRVERDAVADIRED